MVIVPILLDAINPTLTCNELSCVYPNGPAWVTLDQFGFTLGVKDSLPGARACAPTQSVLLQVPAMIRVITCRLTMRSLRLQGPALA